MKFPTKTMMTRFAFPVLLCAGVCLIGYGVTGRLLPEVVHAVDAADNPAAKKAVAKKTDSPQAPLADAYGVRVKNGKITFIKGPPRADKGTRLLLHFEEPASEPEAVVIKDDSPHRHAVTMHGDVMIVADGRTGNGLRLGPAGGWLTIKDSPSLNLLNDFIIECWFKPDEDLPRRNEHRFLLGKYNGQDNLGYALHFRFQNQSLTAWTLNGAGSAGPAYPVKIKAGHWHHFALVCSRKTGRAMFLDGKRVAHDRRVADVRAFPGPLIIGAGDPRGHSAFRGIIDEFHIRSADAIGVAKLPFKAESHFDKDLIAGSEMTAAELPLANGRQIVRNSRGTWFVGFDAEDGLRLAVCDPRRGWQGRIEGRHFQSTFVLVHKNDGVLPVDDPKLAALSLAMDHQDRLHAVWQGSKGIYYARLDKSTPELVSSSEAWTKPNLIAAGNCRLGDIAIDSRGGPWIAYTNEGQVFVARDKGGWKSVLAADRGNIVASVWDPPDSFNYSRTDVVNIPCREPVLALEPNGTVHLAFNRRWEIYYARSRDGNTWQPKPEPVISDGLRSTEERLDLAAHAHSFHPSMVVVDGHPLIVFQNEGMVDLDPAQSSYTRRRWNGVSNVGYAYHDGKRWIRDYIAEPSKEIMAKRQQVFLSTEQQWRPVVGLDPHGVPWVIWNETTRRYNYFARWKGDGFGERREWRGAFYGLSHFCTIEKHPPAVTQIRNNPRYVMGTMVLSGDRLFFCEMPVPLLRAADGRRHQILDLLDFAKTENMETVLNRFQPYEGNPVFTPNPNRLAWDGLKVTPVRVSRLEDGIFRMVYVANGPALFAEHGGNCSAFEYGYAESSDGIHWQRKNLGQIEFQGNRDNNMAYEVHFFEDQQEPDPLKRFKGIVDRRHANYFGGLHVLYSKDSIHWTKGPKLTGQKPGGPHQGGPSYKDLHDFPERKVKAFVRSYNQYGRAVGMMYSPPDMLNWHGFEDLLDDRNPYKVPPKKGERTGWIILEAGGGIEEDQIYGGMAWIEDGVYLMIYQPVRFTGRYQSSLAMSRDGINWYRVKNGQNILELTGAGMFASGKVNLTMPLRQGNELWSYYSYTPWHHNTMQRSGPGGAKGITAGYSDRPSWLTGLGKMRISSWTYAQTANRADEGSLTTIPVDLTDAKKSKIFVNFAGRLQLELIDPETGRSIPGFARADCAQLGGGVDVPVSWRAGEHLARTGKKRIAIRFYLVGNHSRLYSFRFGT